MSTNNIYKSWLATIKKDDGVVMLHEFSIEELSHLAWLIEQEMESRDEQPKIPSMA